ncbi:hypothetical protein N0V88_004064 [Collariella sp. IMI 366227]|nr:hypothetical protein N0V88_004064 [Collariella sp. IMI 366227]
MAEHKPLSIIIVGGGIGGLAAAIGLRRNGHDVHVYERTKMETRYQLGAAIHICPNANAVLRSWGIYAEKAGANLMSRYVELSREGATMKDIDLTEANKRWLHPWHLVRRDAFHQELRSVALSLHGAGLPGDERTAPLVDREDTFVLWYGEDTRMVMYPCNDNQTLNFVGIHPDTRKHRAAWTNAASIKQVYETYKDFDPRLKAVIEKANITNDPLRVWRLLDMEPLSTWTSGRLALMGDAAHPFLPFQAQGAAQAIEDAAALSVVLPKGTPSEEVPERLKLYESIRAERAHRIQDYSRKTGLDRVNGEAVFDSESTGKTPFTSNTVLTIISQ